MSSSPEERPLMAAEASSPETTEGRNSNEVDHDQDEQQQFSDAKELFNFIEEENEDAFVNFNNGSIEDLCDNAGPDGTLLQCACEKRLKRAVEHLLDKKADPNKILEERNERRPIEIAIKHGYYEILSYLLEDPRTKITSKCIIILFKFIDFKKIHEKDHEKCYDILKEVFLKKIEEDFDINALDQNGNSALHYAVRCADSQKIWDLLDMGASLATKNNSGIMPIEDMEPKQLEAHLDTCITFDEWEIRHINDFSVKFNYSSLLPPPKQKGDTNVEAGSKKVTDFIDITEVISYISQTLEFKYLLQHPVIVTFLYMKWRRIRWLFYVNVCFYFVFFASLVTYILTSYANSDVASNSLSIVSYMLLWFTFLILTLKKICKLMISCCQKQNIDNFIEIFLIIVTGCILSTENACIETKRVISSVAIPLSSFELILILGQFRQLNTNRAIFKSVSLNFFNFFIWCFLLILAFALSFYMLLNQNEENLFTDPGKSIIKTITMLTSEFDTNSLDFKTFPFSSMIIVTRFIFLIVLILLNLAAGIAVSDTQQIKNEAELVGYISRVQYIKYVERMLLGNIFPSSLLKRIQSILQSSSVFDDFIKFPKREGETFFINKNKKLNRNLFRSGKLYLDSNSVKRTLAIIKKRLEEKHQFSLEKSVIELQKHQSSLEKSVIELQKMFKEMKRQVLSESIINNS